MNPNQASSSGLVHRRGKERIDGKKKKPMTKLKKIILSDRAARLERGEGKEQRRLTKRRPGEGGGGRQGGGCHGVGGDRRGW